MIHILLTILFVTCAVVYLTRRLHLRWGAILIWVLVLFYVVSHYCGIKQALGLHTTYCTRATYTVETTR